VTWLKVDDRFYDHPKVVELRSAKGGMSAVGLWVLAGAWCAGHGTDGHVPIAIVHQFGKPSQARLLADVGLWEESSGGYQFHDWEQYQPSTKEKRALNRERQRRYRESRNASRNALGDADVRTPVPTRPVPDQEQQPPNPRKRGSRAWSVTPEEQQACEQLFAHMSHVLARDHGVSRQWSVNKTNTPEVLKRLRDGVSVDRLCRGFTARSWEAKQNPESVQYLDAVTPFRDSRWQRTETLIALMAKGGTGILSTEEKKRRDIEADQEQKRRESEQRSRREREAKAARAEASTWLERVTR
jgi:hypothetical protein